MESHRGSTTPWEYLDFELEIREGGPRDYPVSVRSPAGEAQGEMRFPFDEWELKDRLQALEIALLRSGGTRRRIASSEEKTVQDFGRGLFEALLVGEVRTRYEVSLSEARRRNKGLRLKLRIRPPELAVLPWEFLYDAERDRYLCLSSTTPLVRHLDLPQPVEPLPVSPPLRILGLVTSPLGLDPLDVRHEKRLVEESIKDLRADGMLELTWLEGQTWRHLQRAMRRGPWHVFHFVGHGGFDPATEEGAIALSDEAGHKRLLRATSLAELLDDHYPLRLVFLNSCEGARGSNSDAFSSTAATLVRRGVPAVVAMQYEITDKAAIEFSRDFYEAVADGLPVDAAVTEARTAVSMDSMLEWGTPVLYMRSPDGRVFDVLAPASRAQTTPETEDWQEEDLLRRYREAVDSAWADEELQANEVRQLRDLANNELRLASGTAAEIEREVMGDTIETILKRQEEAAREEERNRRLEELYTQARRLHRDRRWQAVIDVFEQIRAEDPANADREGLLASAREALEAQELERRVAAAYAEGQRYMYAGEWQQALECFEEVQRLQPGYRETQTLLSRGRQELAPSPTVEIPDLSGQRIAQARGKLSQKGLRLGGHNEVSSDTVPEGQIIEQNPAAGRQVQTGTPVSVSVSSGASTVEVPDLAGKVYSEARTTLNTAGLKLDAQARAPSDDMPEGRIFKQYPAVGKRVKRGSSVRITISSGPQEKTATAPSGQKGVEAAQARRASTERSATGDQVRRKLWPVGVVVTTIFAVSVLVFGVTYIYYSTTTLVHDFTGKTLSEAADEAAASEVHKELWIAGAAKSSAPKGTIVGQTDGPNTRVGNEDAQSVGLYISGGEGTVEVPDVSGLTKGEASIVLVEAGFDIPDSFPHVNRSGEIVPGYSSDAKITATDPPAGTEVKVGTMVRMKTQ